MTTRTLGSMLLGALLGSACGSDPTDDGPDGIGAQCHAAASCGGDLVGSWVMTDTCSPVSATPVTQVDERCPEARSVTELTSADGAFAAFNPDGTFTMGLITTFRTTTTLPASCIGSDACAEFSSSSGEFTCEARGTDCECSFAMTVPQTSRGSYRVDGSALTFEGPPSVSDIHYCVSGDELRLSWREASGAIQSSRFSRGTTSQPGSYHAAHVLNLASEGALEVGIGDARIDGSFAAVSAPERLAAGTYALTLGGAAAGSLPASAGTATTLVVRERDGVLGLLPVMRPPAGTAFSRDLLVVNASGAPLHAWLVFQDFGAVDEWELAADGEATFAGITSQYALHVDFDGDGMADRAYGTERPSEDMFRAATVMIIGSSENGATAVIADDGAAYARVSERVLTAEVRAVHASEAHVGIVTFTLDEHTLAAGRYAVSERLAAPSRMTHVIARSGETVLAEADIRLEPDRRYLLALLDGHEGPALFVIEEWADGSFVTLVNADPDSERLTFLRATDGGALEATLAADLGLGAAAYFDPGWSPVPPLLLERDGVVGRDSSFFKIDPPVYAPAAILALSDARLLVVPEAGAYIVRPQATAPVTLDVAHLAAGLGPVTVTIGAHQLEASFGGTPRLSFEGGAVAIDVVAAGESIATLSDVELSDGGRYTLLVLGDAADPRIVLSDRRGTASDYQFVDVEIVNGEPSVPNLWVAAYYATEVGPLAFGQAQSTIVNASRLSFKVSFDDDAEHEIEVFPRYLEDAHRLFVFASIAREPVFYEVTLAGTIVSYRGSADEEGSVEVFNLTSFPSLEVATLHPGLDGPIARPFGDVARLALPVTGMVPSMRLTWRFSTGAATLELPLTLDDENTAQLIVYERSIVGPNGEPVGSLAVEVLERSSSMRFLTYGAPPGTTFQPVALYPELDGFSVIAPAVGRDSSDLDTGSPQGDLFGVLVDGEPMPRWTWTIEVERHWGYRFLEDTLMLLDAATDPPQLVVIMRDDWRSVSAEAPIGVVRLVPLHLSPTSFKVGGVDHTDASELWGTPRSVVVPAGTHTFVIDGVSGELEVTRGSYNTIVPLGTGPGPGWTVFDNRTFAPSGPVFFVTNQTGGLVSLHRRVIGDWSDVGSIAPGAHVVVPVQEFEYNSFALDLDGDGTLDRSSGEDRLAVGDRVNYCYLGADYRMACVDNFYSFSIDLLPVP